VSTPPPDDCPDCGLTADNGVRIQSELIVTDTYADTAGHVWAVSRLAVA